MEKSQDFEARATALVMVVTTVTKLQSLCSQTIHTCLEA